jgi:L-ascorbate metabolism protein UlaG (beta-lactamase superfamily)/peptidoglycan/xylan/chitin deacetylase (PgdA/CDA1 family)
MPHALIGIAVLVLAAAVIGCAAVPSVRADAAPAKPVPIVILKLDDVISSTEQGGPVSVRWRRAADYIEKNNLKAAMGVICYSLEEDNPAYFDWIKERQKRGSIEFWLHGYHNRTMEEKTGEFDQGTAAEHQAILEKSQALARKRLGFEFTAFGAHWTGTTEETEKAVQAVDSLKFWLCGPKDSKFYKRLSVPWTIAMEDPIFVPDPVKFKAAYEASGATESVLCLQGHADQWDDERWAGFVKIVEFLKSKGCRFMTPAEYLKSVSVSTPAAAAVAAAKNLTIEKTAQGDLAVQPINHSALRFAFKGKQYYVDPAGEADWATMPKADAIFITHEHGDHLAPKVIDQIKKDGTLIYSSAAVVKKAGFGEVIEVGQTKKVLDITVEAVPAYNLDPERLKYHPKERKDNGYILTFADVRVYVAGDTEGTPEMKALKDIAIAFLPVNLPYTMTPQAAADAARAFKPRILYPYHQGKSDPAEVKSLLADEKSIEVRVLALP